MHRLLQRVQAQRGLRGGDGFVQRAAPGLHLHELCVRAQRHAMQAVALRDQPLVEALFIDAEAFHEVAAIERDGFAERGLRSRGDERLELGHVAVDEGLVHSEEVALLDQDLLLGRDRGQLLAQRGERLPQALPRLIGPGAAPQERGDLLARDALRRLDAEIGEERLRLLRADGDQRAARRSDLHVAQQFKTEGSHCCR